MYKRNNPAKMLQENEVVMLIMGIGVMVLILVKQDTCKKN